VNPYKLVRNPGRQRLFSHKRRRGATLFDPKAGAGRRGEFSPKRREFKRLVGRRREEHGFENKGKEGEFALE